MAQFGGEEQSRPPGAESSSASAVRCSGASACPGKGFVYHEYVLLNHAAAQPGWVPDDRRVILYHVMPKRSTVAEKQTGFNLPQLLLHSRRTHCSTNSSIDSSAGSSTSTGNSNCAGDSAGAPAAPHVPIPMLPQAQRRSDKAGPAKRSRISQPVREPPLPRGHPQLRRPRRWRWKWWNQ